ncbi:MULTISPECIES: phosphodiester glycosidase family protein [unclassified Mesorhizobium]|uniref:phosphodiester glycosidase family protein n=1 Tax=unclassified Mesorhizobium TaxID=325217 RepID=UPI0030143CAF
MKRALAAILLIAGLAALAMLVWRRPEPPAVPPVFQSQELPEPCREQDYEGIGYIVCTIDPHAYDIGLFHDGADGKPFGSVDAFTRAMKAQGTPVLLAMNAGMYHRDLSPVGLYVEDGITKEPLNLSDGDGNFFMKPNGVFAMTKSGEVLVMESEAFAAARPDVRLGTQSGPMLVIDGVIHARFEPNGSSRNVRNGVGVSADGKAIFVIARSPVSFGSFARLFSDGLKCRNALYFDGFISAFSNGSKLLVGKTDPAGPILAVSRKR